MRGNGVRPNISTGSALELRQVEFDMLHEARQVGDDQDLSRPGSARTKASILRLSGWRNSQRAAAEGPDTACAGR